MALAGDATIRVASSTYLSKRLGDIGDDRVDVKLEDLVVDVDGMLP